MHGLAVNDPPYSYFVLPDLGYSCSVVRNFKASDPHADGIDTVCAVSLSHLQRRLLNMSVYFDDPFSQ
jgi:hypothetical protein